MVWATPGVTPQAVVERGWSSFEAVVTQWGVNDLYLTFPSNDVSSPTVNVVIPSVFGVAVGPESTVDRFSASWDINLSIDSSSIVSPFYQLCSIGQPCTNPLGGPVVIASDINQRYGTQFVADDGVPGSTLNFSFQASNTDTFTRGTITPQVHFVAFLQATANMPMKRYPYVGYAGATTAATPIAVTTYIRGWPVMGRKRCRVTIFNTGGSDAVMRIGGIGAIVRQTSTSAGLALPREVTLQTAFTVVASGLKSYTFDSSALANVNFLTLYINSMGANTTVYAVCEAFDD